ncbi:L-dopachrome tautomerase-related protein [uncultured Massilia sp.]|uniref:L-dopachrome tautomerase-related protein n=1 Tax=uncultured Massilia sp. TaxID=169973 RepID=UPI0025E00F97|nr:L-dopachrome tautomerase-related protein [uncultured Massilia sp.]
MKRLMISTLVAGAAFALAGTGAAATATPAPASATAPAPGLAAIERVAEFDGAMPTGVTVSEDGRIFVNFPRWGDDVRYSVAEVRDGRTVPYPDAAFNREHADPARGLISVQSVVADGRGRLWILDTAAPGFAAPKAGGAKLVAVDLKTDKVVKTVVFPPEVILPTTYVNDMRFDFRVGAAGVAYVTDSSLTGPGAIIVIDLATGKASRRLSGHPSTAPDPAFAARVDDKALAGTGADGKPQPFTVASDGIALSPDGETLYFCALSSRALYAVPTRLLRDPGASDADVARAVRYLGEKGASDGLEADAAGNVYGGDYEHDAIRRLAPDGGWSTIAQGPDLSWPDTLSVGPDGYLYVMANQLHRQAGFNGGVDARRKPYRLLRVKIGTAPAYAGQ